MAHGADETTGLVSSSSGFGIQSLDQFRLLNEEFNRRVEEIKSIPTPREHIKQREDGFDYPEYAYMLNVMDKYFPLRDEDVKITIEEKTLVVLAIARVVDILTKQGRTGADAHRLTFKKDKEKTLSTVVDIGNDTKSAVTESLRNAYSRFGVCTDVYNKVLRQPITLEQRLEFDKFEKEYLGFVELSPDDKKQGLLTWLHNVKISYATQNRGSFPDFIASKISKFNAVKDKAAKGDTN